MAGMTQPWSLGSRSPPGGDKVQDRPLAEIGGKALWTKELERMRCMTREIDMLRCIR
jgi:porphobilinogen deaminase